MDSAKKLCRFPVLEKILWEGQVSVSAPLTVTTRFSIILE
jgi:hypothetical protein